MKILLRVFILIIGFISICNARGINGGMNCAVCTVVTGVVQQDAYIKRIAICDAAKHLCKKLPKLFRAPCYETINKLEPFFTNKRVLDLFTPDLFCYALRSCHEDPGEQFCHLFPKPHTSFKKNYNYLEEIMIEYDVHSILQRLHRSSLNEYVQDRNTDIFKPHHLKKSNLKQKNVYYKNSEKFPVVNFCAMPVLKQICDIFLGTFHTLKPAIDIDGDGFSFVSSARGSDWKGKDCDDLDRKIYPGAQKHELDPKIDTNCNGIWGLDPVSGRPWEEILCEGTQSKGLVYLGDSVGAHFHFPEAWMNPTIPNKSSIITKLEALLDELDWPELGFATGYKNSSHPDIIKGLTDSIYLRMRSNNLCNHRDYQNIARNGAMSWDTMEEVNATSRNPSDKPVLLIYAMVGNDVCNRFHNTVANMTKPADFRRLVMQGLQAIDKKLPLNSDVVLLSLLDAGFVYPNMAERIHPLGSLFKNIKYKDMYSWFSCMEIGPCEGWMTANATLRNITSQKAVELSNVLQSIASNTTFKSFHLHYLKNPFGLILDKWVAQGGEIYQLIDPVDSTHPNQQAQQLIAAVLWDSLQNLGVIGPKNPQNAKILKLFRDQGGH